MQFYVRLDLCHDDQNKLYMTWGYTWYGSILSEIQLKHDGKERLHFVENNYRRRVFFDLKNILEASMDPYLNDSVDG